jgi:hypothetical protein
MKRALPFLLVLFIGLVLVAAAPPAGAQSEPPAPGDSTGVIPDSTVFAGIHWRTAPPIPCAAKPLNLAFEYCSCNITILGGGQDPSGLVRLHARIDNRIDCIRCAPETFFVPLGQYTAGYYMVMVEITADFVDADSVVHTEVVTRPFYFIVSPDCTLPPGPLPYVTRIQIGQPSPCIECPPIACPNDSILVIVEGEFPDDCVWFKGLELLPSPIMGPLPEPPVLRIVYEHNPCLDRPCFHTPYPWRATVMLPPLPVRDYRLMAEAILANACAPAVPELIGQTSLPFTVVDSCGPPTPQTCFLTRFAGASIGGDCDVFVGPQRPAELTLTIATDVALAGLQGEFNMYPPGLRITGLEAIGPAQGMRLTWKPTEMGASFVLFADSGAPIPGDVRCRLSLNRCFAPILRLTAEMPAGGIAPDRTEIYTGAFLGSDSTGQAVYPCPTITLDQSLVIDGATICRAMPCDVNGDGVSDIRDLVVMVHCVLGAGYCPDPMPPNLDCDRDGGHDIDDVLCCARSMLGGDAPPDTGVSRPAPEVAVTFGEPVRTAAGVDVPLRLAGADGVGAARLELAYPDTRYDVAGVELTGAATNWLALHQVQDGRLVVALIDAAGAERGGVTALDLLVRLALKPEHQPGGSVSLAGGSFSGTDGVALAVELGSPSATLAVPVRLDLSAARPNPFVGQTRFTVTLSAPATLEVGVYDLQGRLVASLHRGPAAAGELEFTWDRRRDAGGLAPSGVYFYRAAADGDPVTRKLVVMGRE